METRNILLVGVGGQGVLLASEILSLGFLKAGFDVKKSEVHGMAQRGGTVSSHVRYGSKVYSPLIKKGDADLLMAFECLEALRWISFLKKEGTLLVNRQEIKPTSVTSGMMKYPEHLSELLVKIHPRTYIIEGLELAKKAGDARSINSIMVGAASREISISDSVWKEVIQERMPNKVVPVNVRAFEMGRNLKQQGG